MVLTELWIHRYAATMSQLSQLKNQMMSQFFNIVPCSTEVPDSLWLGYGNITEAHKQSRR